MKQAEDNKTIDLLGTAKRGRGRPRVDNPLTQAERAKRYREKKLLENRDVTKTKVIESDSRLADLVGALDTVSQYAVAGKRIPAHITKGLLSLLADS